MDRRRRRTDSVSIGEVHSFSDFDKLISRADLSCPQELPISSIWDDLVEAIRDNQVLILTGETGSGKTTQLPKACLLAGMGRAGKVVCTQPRRIAAVTIASRLSEELGPLGSRLVGYKIRFRDKTGPFTRIQYVTDGLLLSEFHKDPGLSRYDTIIVDEAHERSLNIDVLLGILKKLLPKRKDLKTIITSATIDTELFAKAFKDAPVLRIHGRTFPVDKRYRPFEKTDDLSEKVSLAIDEIKAKDPMGDILVFLPTEQDINETVRILKGKYKDRAIVLPLFGRLSHKDQKTVFKPAGLSKIIVATNIAETSLTVPGIKYVVDSGLARISLYNPGIRTMTLPVVPVSRASTDQRAGRAGRLGPGECIRLFSEEDQLERPLYTPPEILRSNLSEVILRLIALDLAPVEDFPFIEPPSSKSILEGKTTLKEIGALTDKEKLTRIGRSISRLPLDPRISRMILQARQENALREILVIASALSIQDPRERPRDSQAAAQNAHAPFINPLSDFMTLLNIWDAYEGLVKSKATKKEIREFCKERFLSYNRLMEWRDIRKQLKDILSEAGGFRMNSSGASYQAIHRSIISGFLSQLAMKKEGSLYAGANGKEIYLHPGSSIYKKRPQWIVASELIKTSRLYARTAAHIEPEWVEDLAAHLTKIQYHDPHWEKARGEVIAWKKISLFGLPIVEKRRASYKRIDSEKSKEIFICEGLSTGNLKGSYPAMRSNLKARAEAKELEYKIRRQGLISDQEIMASFYKKAVKTLEEKSGISPILDEASFSRALKRIKDDSFLRITREEIIKGVSMPEEMALYPGFLKMDGMEIPLRYRFQPGEKEDGITARIPLHLLDHLPCERFEWLVPGFLQEKIEAVLKRLPKKVRNRLQPLSKTSEELASSINEKKEGIIPVLRREIALKYGVPSDPDIWPDSMVLPHHLLMRFEIIDTKGRVVDSGRDMNVLKDQWKRRGKDISKEDPQLKKIREKWEKGGYGLKDIPDIPKEITLDSPHIKTVYPGYKSERQGVGVQIFLTRKEASIRSSNAMRHIILENLKKEISYMKKHSLKGVISQELCFWTGGEAAFKDRFIQMIIDEIMGNWEKAPRPDKALHLANDLKKTIHSKVLPYLEKFAMIDQAFALTYREILKLQDSSMADKGHNELCEEFENELLRLIPRDFPIGRSMKDLEQTPRYLKALAIRVQRASADPLKDKNKKKALIPYLKELDELQRLLPEKNGDTLEGFKKLKNMMEEYRVSLFAPELGTLIKVSPKRLEKAFRDLKNGF